MKFSSVIYILVLFGLTRSIPLPKSNNAKGMGHEKFSESQRQVLLYRLDHAAGDEHQLGFFKMLLLSQNSVGSCKEQGNCIEDIVNTIEQVALWYTINLEARNLTALRQAKYYTEQLKDVERDYQTRLNSLPEPFKYWYALSMNESISSFLGYELKKL
ncbi:hypothetical protein ZYGR_0I02600 [Zygosaccharomyces rouxii]|uniref:Uncharacterized protein n=1 Tax=Zygosaccharomyces rouxii TaxID=4956 RepID=A0A1Q2ZX44_ZYGRO|nr:hypothetical protein ZYGR_0I02600 [Zygosaccharomyces rouxii]